MDPRVRTSLAGLLQQFTLSMQIYDDVRASSKTMEEMHAFGEQLHERLKTDNSEKLVELEKNVRALEGEPAGRAGRRGASGPDTFSSVSGTLTGLLQGLPGSGRRTNSCDGCGCCGQASRAEKVDAALGSVKGAMTANSYEPL